MLIRPRIAMTALNGARLLGEQLGRLPSVEADVVNPTRRFSISSAARAIYLLLRERLGRWDLFLRRAISKFIRKYKSSREETVISLAPLELSTNKYVALFAKAIADQKYTIAVDTAQVAGPVKADPLGCPIVDRHVTGRGVDTVGLQNVDLRQVIAARVLRQRSRIAEPKGGPSAGTGRQLHPGFEIAEPLAKARPSVGQAGKEPRTPMVAEGVEPSGDGQNAPRDREGVGRVGLARPGKPSQAEIAAVRRVGRPTDAGGERSPAIAQGNAQWAAKVLVECQRVAGGRSGPGRSERVQGQTKQSAEKGSFDNLNRIHIYH
jgi:hypothetical protein